MTMSSPFARRSTVGVLLALAGWTGCDLPPEQGDGTEVVSQGLVEEQVASEADLDNPVIALPYATRVYGHFQSASKSAITFTVATLATGNAQQIAQQTVNSLLGVPGTWIQHERVGTDIVRVWAEPRNPVEDEWVGNIWLSKFDELGHPTSAALYRLLQVKSTLAGVVRTHKALELCWSTQSYCIVMDPVVQQLDSFAEGRASLKVAGWKTETTGMMAGAALAEASSATAAQSAAEAVAARRYCSLNGHPRYGSWWLTWAAWTQKYKNVFGMTLVTKHLGGQQAGISCFINSAGACRSSGFGYSNDSSCSGTLGYSCACRETGVQRGTTGATTKTWAQTKCTHKLIGSASVSWTRNGSGSGFSIAWNTNGGVDSNGGSILDACSWHWF